MFEGLPPGRRAARGALFGRMGAQIGGGIGQGLFQGMQQGFAQQREDELTRVERERQERLAAEKRERGALFTKNALTTPPPKGFSTQVQTDSEGGASQMFAPTKPGKPEDKEMRDAKLASEKERAAAFQRSHQPKDDEGELWLTAAEWEAAGGTKPGSGVTGEVVAAQDAPEEIRARDPEGTTFYKAAKASRRVLQERGVGTSSGGKGKKQLSPEQLEARAQRVYERANGAGQAVDASIANAKALPELIAAFPLISQQASTLTSSIKELENILDELPEGQFKAQLDAERSKLTQIAANAARLVEGKGAASLAGDKVSGTYKPNPPTRSTKLTREQQESLLRNAYTNAKDAAQRRQLLQEMREDGFGDLATELSAMPLAQ